MLVRGSQGPRDRATLLSAASHGAPPDSAPDPSIRLPILVSGGRPAWRSLDIPRSLAPRRHRPSRSKFSRPDPAGTRATSAISRRRPIGEPPGTVGAGLPSGSNAASGECVIQTSRLKSLWKCGEAVEKRRPRDPDAVQSHPDRCFDCGRQVRHSTNRRHAPLRAQFLGGRLAARRTSHRAGSDAGEGTEQDY